MLRLTELPAVYLMQTETIRTMTMEQKFAHPPCDALSDIISESVSI